jgi:hypothetical protein
MPKDKRNRLKLLKFKIYIKIILDTFFITKSCRYQSGSCGIQVSQGSDHGAGSADHPVTNPADINQGAVEYKLARGVITEPAALITR